MMTEELIGLKEQLEEIISDQDISENADYHNIMVNNIDKILNGSSFVLFGAGSLGKMVLAGLRKMGLEPIAFSDNNKNLWGTYISDVLVLSPNSAVNSYGKSSVFIIAVWNPHSSFLEIKNQLLKSGCRNVVSFIALFYKYSDAYMPYYCLDLPNNLINYPKEISSVFELWDDNESRIEYLNQIRFRISGNLECLSAPIEGDQYFPKGLFRLKPNEVFVDCGAYTGDTINAFLQRWNEKFYRIFAFEPDPMNYHKLIGYVNGLEESVRENIYCFNNAVGLGHEIVKFNSDGTESSKIGEEGSSESLEIRCTSIDQELINLSPTFIKMDIEGYEIEALTGAQETIKRNIPILAISVYHKQSHIWEIPRLIYSLNQKYRFFLRNHRYDGWDLVCYAIPPDRVMEVIHDK